MILIYVRSCPLHQALCTVCKYEDIQVVTPLMERLEDLLHQNPSGPSGSEVESFQNNSQWPMMSAAMSLKPNYLIFLLYMVPMFYQKDHKGITP